MKKQSLAALALVLATSGMASVPQNMPQEQKTTQSQKHNEAVEKTPTTVRQGRPTALNPTGGYIDFWPVVRTPKEYGQWLQFNRKQKWTKKRRFK